MWVSPNSIRILPELIHWIFAGSGGGGGGHSTLLSLPSSDFACVNTNNAVKSDPPKKKKKLLFKNHRNRSAYIMGLLHCTSYTHKKAVRQLPTTEIEWIATDETCLSCEEYGEPFLWQDTRTLWFNRIFNCLAQLTFRFRWTWYW